MLVVVGSLVLHLQDVRLGQQEDRDRSECKNEEEILDFCLAGIHRIVHISWSKGNVDKGSDQVRWLATTAGTTITQRTQVSGSSAVEAVNTSWCTVAISFHIAHLPVLLPVAALGVEAGSGKHALVPVNAPLHEDQDDHVNKQGSGKYNHRNNLKVQIELFSEVNGVDTLQNRTKEHLENTKDDTQLHLERVKEKKLVGSDVPDRIKAEWVNRFVGTKFSSLIGNIALFDLQLFLTIEFPATSEKIESEREAIVVDHTGIHSEKSHHENHVTPNVEAFRQFVPLDSFGFFLVQHQHDTGEEQEHTVSNITVHHSEKEWECSGGEQGRIGFSITRNTVRVDEFLVRIGELVGHKVGRRSRPRLGNVIDKTWHRHIHVGMSLFDGKFDLFEVLANDPSFSTEHTRDIGLEPGGVVNPWNLWICKAASCDSDVLNQVLNSIAFEYYKVGQNPYPEGTIISDTITPTLECHSDQIGKMMRTPEAYCSGESAPACSNKKLIEVQLGTDAPFELAICDDNDCLASLKNTRPLENAIDGYWPIYPNTFCVPEGSSYRQEFLSIDITILEKDFNLSDYCSAAAASGRTGLCETPTEAPTVKAVASETESAPAESAGWMTMESFVLKCFVRLISLLLL